jgi:transposase
VSRDEVEAESKSEALPSTPEESHADRTQKHPGRQTLPVHLPRVEKIVACTPEQCVCNGCGAETTVIGYEESEQLDVVPAKYFVLVTRREKRACKRCEERGVVAAPLPERIIEKSLVSDRIVIDTIIAKYCDALPLYRQSAMLKRDTDLDISRSTINGWVMRVGQLLLPIAGAMRRELLSGSYIQADETPVDVQMHDGRGQNHQGYLWQYGNPGRWCGLQLSPGPWTRRTEAVSRTVQRHPADRRLRRLRPHRRAEDGSCRVLVACAKEVHRGGEAASAGCGRDRHREANG